MAVNWDEVYTHLTIFKDSRLKKPPT